MKEKRRFLKDIPYIVAVALIVVAAAIFGALYNNNIAQEQQAKDSAASAAKAEKADAAVHDVVADDNVSELKEGDIDQSALSAEPEGGASAVAAEKDRGQPVEKNRDRYDDDYVSPEEREGLISKADAKAKALAHAGLSESDIRAYEIELDRERSVIVYEIDFKSGRFEYSYEINAKNGNVVKSEKEFDD